MTQAFFVFCWGYTGLRLERKLSPYPAVSRSFCERSVAILLDDDVRSSAFLWRSNKNMLSGQRNQPFLVHMSALLLRIYLAPTLNCFAVAL
jgi:hypothetical protein